MAVTALLLLELGLYVSCFVCGIVAAASTTIVQGNFGGLCILYGLVNYNATAGLIGVQCSSGPSTCHFVSTISFMVAGVCFFLFLYTLYVRRERVWMNLIVCGFFLFFLLISGCMLKIGRDSLCNSVLQAVPNIRRCEEAQTRTWAAPLKGERFYTSLLNAETAVWVNFFSWLIIGVLVVVQRSPSSGASSGPISGPAGGHFSAPRATVAETEPFFDHYLFYSDFD